MNRTRQADYGTPRPANGKTVSVEIDGQPVTVEAGSSILRAQITERVKPGVVYTTFHNPETGANVVTTEYSDWATNCPEYKVTALQIAPASHRSKWQDGFQARAKRQGHIVEAP